MFNKKKTPPQPTPEAPGGPEFAASSSLGVTESASGGHDPSLDSSASRIPKQTILLYLLRRPSGASLVELCEASSWQAHSVRGFLSGTVRKKLALPLVSVTVDGTRIYQIVGRGPENNSHLSSSMPSSDAASASDEAA